MICQCKTRTKRLSAMAETRRFRSTRRDFLIGCLLLCCALITMASLTFAMYTVREFATLKARVSELEESLSNLLNPADDVTSDKTMHVTDNLNQDESTVETKRVTVKAQTVCTKCRRRHKIKKNVCIHLAGSGRMIETRRQAVNNWNIVHSSGNVTYSDQLGSITIDVPGLYFIYSQLQLMQGRHSRSLIWQHTTRINNKNVLRSVLTPQYHRSLKYQSNYQAGIFPLQKGDNVSIGSQFGRQTNHELNYFGLFRIRMAH